VILDSFMINVSSGQLRNNLTEIGPDNQLRGELAEEWEASADAATWTFKLRKGVEFHNGKTVSAEDVVESFRHHMGEDTKSAAKGIIAAVESVEADGKDTVVFKLSGGNADFPFIASDSRHRSQKPELLERGRGSLRRGAKPVHRGCGCTDFGTADG